MDSKGLNFNCAAALKTVKTKEGIEGIKEKLKKSSGLKLTDAQVVDMLNSKDFKRTFIKECEQTKKMLSAIIKLVDKSPTKKRRTVKTKTRKN